MLEPACLISICLYVAFRQSKPHWEQEFHGAEYSWTLSIPICFGKASIFLPKSALLLDSRCYACNLAVSNSLSASSQSVLVNTCLISTNSFHLSNPRDFLNCHQQNFCKRSGDYVQATYTNRPIQSCSFHYITADYMLIAYERNRHQFAEEDSKSRFRPIWLVWKLTSTRKEPLLVSMSLLRRSLYLPTASTLTL